MPIIRTDLDIGMVNLMIDVAELASLKTRIEDDKINPYMSLREAHRKFGMAQVNRWIREGLIRKRKDGGNNSKCHIDRLEIEALSKANSRI